MQFKCANNRFMAARQTSIKSKTKWIQLFVCFGLVWWQPYFTPRPPTPNFCFYLLIWMGVVVFGRQASHNIRIVTRGEIRGICSCCCCCRCCTCCCSWAAANCAGTSNCIVHSAASWAALLLLLLLMLTAGRGSLLDAVQQIRGQIVQGHVGSGRAGRAQALLLLLCCLLVGWDATTTTAAICCGWGRGAARSVKEHIENRKKENKLNNE